MSEMSYMEKLLEGVEVEWVALGTVTQIKTGQSVNKDIIAQNPGEFPVINSGKEPLGYIDQWNTENDPIGITSRGAGVGSITWREGRYFRGNLNYAVTIKEASNLETKFLLHLLLQMQREIQALCTYDGIPALNAGSLKELQIPIPCPKDPKRSLEIQSEIVRILDAFTELTTELTNRKKQYNHYRDQLLSFEDGEVGWKTLGEVAIFKRGTAITKKQTTSGKIPVVANGPQPTYYHSEINRDGETIVIARSGAYAGYVSFWNEPIFLTDAFSVHPHASLLTPKFVYFLLQNKQTEIHEMKKGAGVPHVRVKEFESYLVPIPSLAEQARIVAILDKFDTLTHSIR
jgi:type I restriction enzyme, S subunit